MTTGEILRINDHASIYRKGSFLDVNEEELRVSVFKGSYNQKINVQKIIPLSNLEALLGNKSVINEKFTAVPSKDYLSIRFIDGSECRFNPEEYNHIKQEIRFYRLKQVF